MECEPSMTPTISTLPRARRRNDFGSYKLGKIVSSVVEQPLSSPCHLRQLPPSSFGYRRTQSRLLFNYLFGSSTSDTCAYVSEGLQIVLCERCGTELRCTPMCSLPAPAQQVAVGEPPSVFLVGAALERMALAADGDGSVHLISHKGEILSTQQPFGGSVGFRVVCAEIGDTHRFPLVRLYLPVVRLYFHLSVHP